LPYFSIIGASGKLGKLICSELALKKIEFTAVDRNSLENFEFAQCHIILDVSHAKATKILFQNLLKDIRNNKILPNSFFPTLVVGTTGHDTETLALAEQYAKFAAVCFIPNFSLGILILEEMLSARTAVGMTVQEMLRSFNFDLSIFEKHHEHKVDSPSGTALRLASRVGVENDKIASLRSGNIIGEHTIFAEGHSESIYIQHAARTRDVFSLGAVKLIQDITEKKLKVGFYKSLNEVYASINSVPFAPFKTDSKN
jgi:4-hydroxy-tetrahydrodipicolinate reductase